ncbi:MAG: response regulator transcription factor [Phycisphaeraceae bacterium]|nr:response regulator transcription factor [Phycisphaeraceae bacterium]
MGMPLRVGLVDGQGLHRHCLAFRLQAEAWLHVVMECETLGPMFGTKTEQNVELALVHYDSFGWTLFDELDQLLRLNTKLSVLLMMDRPTQRALQQAANLGVTGCVSTGESIDVLLKAIRSSRPLASPGCWSAGVLGQLHLPLTTTIPPAGRKRRGQDLTSREISVLILLARGLTRKQIAQELHLSVKTVEGHSDRIMRKLNLHDRVELARYAIRESYEMP